MTSDENREWSPLSDDGDSWHPGTSAVSERIDSLLPADPETGVVVYDAFRIYLGGFIDLMGRHEQPLTLLTIAPDPSNTLRVLGSIGARLIASAIARCLRQETRIYDVIGRGRTTGPYGAPAFHVALPMMTEEAAKSFAHRLREAMTISTADVGRPWLTLSVGVASLSIETDTPELLIFRAQEALASAQRNGGDRIWSHTDTIRRIIDRDQPHPSQE